MINKIYPRKGDTQTTYLNVAIEDPSIEVDDYTIYNDFALDPYLFEQNNVLYHYPINHERSIIGEFCSIACGVKFLFDCINHTLEPLSAYTFPLFCEDWGLDKANVASAWGNEDDIVMDNDVWVGYEAVIMASIHIGDGAIVGTRAVVTEDMLPYTIVGGVPAKEIRRRFSPDIIEQVQALRWWDWSVDEIREFLPYLKNGRWDKLQTV